MIGAGRLLYQTVVPPQTPAGRAEPAPLCRIRLRDCDDVLLGPIRQADRDDLAEILVDIGQNRQRWFTFAYDDVLMYAVEPETAIKETDVNAVAQHLEVLHPTVDGALLRKIAATAVRLGAKPPNMRPVSRPVASPRRR